MASFDRAGFIELLDRLGGDNDATVLEAARALHRKAAESGLSWDDLLALDSGDDHEDHEPAEEAAVELSPAELSADNAEALRLIERLLRKDVSETLRDDLTEMKRNIADGSLDAADRRYVRALAKRLGV
jgi:hypothetical protein